MSSDHPQNTLRRWLAPPLIVFVLISIGFALGRMSAARVPDLSTEPASSVTDPQTRVLVQYFHGTLRCVSCNTIEDLLRACLTAHYAEALAAGDLVFRDINFDQNDSLAARYDISSSIPLLTSVIDSREARAHQLHAVWELKDDRELFDNYIIEEINAALSAAGLSRWKATKP